MPWPDIIKKYPSMIELTPEKRKNKLALHIPANEIPKLTSDTENTQDSKEDGQGPAEIYMVPVSAISGQKSLGSQNTPPLRVGIRNKEPMSPEQMKMVHRHLLIAITKQFTGGGPEFLSFTHKRGWIQITCVDQRSKDWLVEEVQSLEPWPGVLLSIVPEEQLPNPPKVVTMIPESEAGSVQEALDLLRAQNKGLNTGHWQVLHERVEKDKSRTVTFIIDEKSFETLKDQNFQAALGFKIVTFRIKDGGSQLLRRPATKDEDPVTPDSSTKLENSEDLGLTYVTNSMETDRDKHSSTQAKGNDKSGIVDLTVDQDGFAALAAAEKVTSQANYGFGARFIQNKGVIDLTENKDEVSGKNRSRAQTSQPKFGSRPTIQNSLRPGDVRLGQGSKEVNQTPVRGSQSSQGKNGVHLTENRDRTPRPEEGGYSSWIIQDPESFTAGIVPGLSFLNTGGPPTDYEPRNIQDPTRTSTGQDSSDRRLSPSKDDRLPKSYRLPVKRSRKDRGTDRDRPPRLNRPSPQRRNSQDSQRYDRPAYSQDSGRGDTVKSWENSTRGHPRLMLWELVQKSRERPKGLNFDCVDFKSTKEY
ncbi:uncharacterized protein LOC134659079 [Cydia amplana]|uniref:uncharacterized protein LOC134659079 n=1 Tax=Cydia amplana TaxID=1869771 RepID=UPI002FE59928